MFYSRSRYDQSRERREERKKGSTLEEYMRRSRMRGKIPVEKKEQKHNISSTRGFETEEEK